MHPCAPVPCPDPAELRNVNSGNWFKAYKVKYKTPFLLIPFSNDSKHGKDIPI